MNPFLLAAAFAVSLLFLAAVAAAGVLAEHIILRAKPREPKHREGS